jgi:hypothetical protein
MQIGIDSFAASISDPATGLNAQQGGQGRSYRP